MAYAFGHEAIAHYEAARAFGRVVPEHLVHGLYSALGRAYELAADMPAAAHIYRELLERARTRRLDGLECLALNRLATLKAQVEMDTPAALALLDAAQRAAERSGAPLNRAETEWNLAQIHYYSRNLQAARAHAAEATRLARQIGQPDVLARCLNVSAYVLGDLGDFGAAQAYAEEARAHYAGLLTRVMEVDCLCVLAGILVARSEHGSGAHQARLALQLSDGIGNTCGQVFSRYHLAKALADAGSLSEALALLTEALGTGADAASPLVVSLCRNAMGSSQRSLGDVDAALATHLANTPALPPSGPLPSDFSLADFVSGVSLGDLCADYAVLGRWDDAARCARLVAEAAHLVPAYARLRTLWFEVEALARSGDVASAQRTLDAFTVLAGDSPRCAIARLRAEAILATPADGLALLSEALTLARQLNLPVEAQELEAGPRVSR